jgi:hypothetical protein
MGSYREHAYDGETPAEYMKRLNIWRVPENSIYTKEIEMLERMRQPIQ